MSLKFSRFLFLEKCQETCVCESQIRKIQTSTGLYKSISVCLMTKEIFQIILSSTKFWSNILISTKPLTHLPLLKQTIATKRALMMLLFVLFLQKYSPTPPCPLLGFVLLNPTPIMPRKNCYLTVCSLVSRLGKETVSSGAIKRLWKSFIISWCMMFKTKSHYSKKILVTPFLKNGRVQYS